MESLLDLVADRFKLAIAIIIVLLGAFRWLVGRRDLQFNRRREFVQTWRDPCGLDALSIEVMVRQLFGAYVPASLVRKVCERTGSDVARMLSELGEVWSLLDWDGSSGLICWKGVASTRRKRLRKVVFLWLGYFLSAFTGGMILYFVAVRPVTPALAVASVMWGGIFIAIAVVALARLGVWGAAMRLGDDFVCRVNDCTGKGQVILDMSVGLSDPTPKDEDRLAW